MGFLGESRDEAPVESRGSKPEQGEPRVGHKTLGGDFNQQRM